MLDSTMYTLTVLLACALLAVRVPATPVAEDKLQEDLNLNIDLTSRSDQNDIVNKHNTLRRAVQPTASNMLKMSWNTEAAANAQKWANGCSMNHSPHGHRTISTSGCGENLYMSSSNNTWDEAIQPWYDEVENYRYGVGGVNGARLIGQYTQLVWYRSNQIGCYKAHCPHAMYQYFYVCHYCPPGNYQYTHPYKSGTPCADCPNACDNKLCTNPCPYVDQYSNCLDLKQQYGCSNAHVQDRCPASCKCTNEII